jgi:LPXTG-motif cell wall-anchored protein
VKLIPLRRRSAATAVAATVACLLVTGAAAANPPVSDPADGRIAHAGSATAIPGSYLVMLKPGTPVDTVDRLAAEYDGMVIHRYPSIRGFAVNMSADRAAALVADPAVASVEADTTVTTTAVVQPDPPSWGLDRIDQAALPLDSSYTQPGSAAAVTVYVIDSGIRISHQEFGGRASNGWDFVDSDAVAQDGDGHGTHVAATIGGDTFGVAKDVNLVAVRVLDDQGNGARADSIAAIDWVITHATLPAVINMSIGGANGGLSNAAVKAATDAGIVVVAAAGNDNIDACGEFPAGAPEAITVGAAGKTDARASFSNWGGCVDLFAPGEQIVSAYNTSDTASEVLDGTSMAAPHVAGAAALKLAADPTATPPQVQHDLIAAATPDMVTALPACTTGRLLTVGLPAGPVWADVPPAATGDLTAPEAAEAGVRIAVTGSGFGSGATVQYTLYPGAATLGQSTASPSGTALGNIVLPGNLTCDVTVVATGLDGLGVTRVLAARVTISAPPVLTPPTPAPALPLPAPVATLPITGSEPIGIAAAGASILLLGTAIIVMTSRRRRNT